MSETLTVHRLAGLVPEMLPDEYGALVADVRAHGLLEPIVLFQGQVLDGRHRYRACLETGTEPRFRPYEGDDPLGFVVSANLQRRHLTSSQRAVLALAFESEFAVQAKERQGARTDLTSSQSCQDVEHLHAAERAAAMVGVSARLVSDAKHLRREAPDRLAGVLSGEYSLHEAIKEGRHQRRRAAVEAATLDPPPLNEIGPFAVLYADPAWRYENVHPTRAIENHYPTMSLEEIKALEVPACGDSVLFLWAPSPMLPGALEVMSAWGFQYRTSMVWVKDKIGMGWWVRQRHELLLIGRRGAMHTPDAEDEPESVIEAPRTGHSEKPPVVYEIIERMYPLASRVELFARQRRDGWAAWGNQLPQ
jgi:N6-adenosine-specific RNA methylase IME4/ParB-like chromosome segregation protein Spo0J